MFRLPHLKHVILIGEKTVAPGTHHISDVMDLGSEADRFTVEDVCRSLDPHDPVNILFTSVRCCKYQEFIKTLS